MINTLNNLKSTFSPERHKIQLEIIDFLGDVLNDYHKVNFSSRFWHLWLISYANYVVNNFNYFNSDDFIPTIGNTAGEYSVSFKTKLIHWVKTVKSLPKFITFTKTLQNASSIHIGFPDLKQVNDDLGEKLPLIDKKWSFRYSSSKRRFLERKYGNTDSVLLNNVVKALPKLYLEGFKEAYDSIPLFEPEKKIFHFHIGNKYNKMLVAKYIEGGSKLHWYQHGAYYGELRYGAQVNERNIANIYRTWGWRMEEKDEPWKAYRLIKFIQNYSNETKDVNFPLLIVFGQINSAYTNTSYFENFIADFDNLICKSKYPKIAARPRPTSKVFSNLNEIKFLRRYKYFQICSDLELITKNIANAQLVFQVSVPSTNFLECIAINKPVVGILNNDQMTDIVKPFYEFCIVNDILHKDLSSLIAHLNRIDIDTWWNDILQNKQYQYFKSLFANTQ